MTDPVSQAEQAAKSAVSGAVTDAKQTASAFEQKQAGWARRNWLALAIGASIGAVIGHLL